MNLTPDALVARIVELNKEVNNDREKLLTALAGMGFERDQAEDVLCTIDSAAFRASVQHTGLRHSTSFEGDPVFIAALKHFGQRHPQRKWWQFWK